MIQQNELITFLVAAGVTLFLIINRRRIVQIPGSSWLLLSYSALFMGWFLTLVEGFVLENLMNILEHACYMASSLTAAVWCWAFLVKGVKAR